MYQYQYQYQYINQYHYINIIIIIYKTEEYRAILRSHIIILQETSLKKKLNVEPVQL